MQIGCCWKFGPHLTFGWPFVNISLTMHPTYIKLYIFVILITSRVIWYTWKVIWSILKIWPPLDPCVTPTGKGPNHPKFCQNIFWPITTLKLSITHFRQNGTWVLLPLQSSIVYTLLRRTHSFSVQILTNVTLKHYPTHAILVICNFLDWFLTQKRHKHNRK